VDTAHGISVVLSALSLPNIIRLPKMERRFLPLLFLSSFISAQAADLKTLSIASANDYLVSRNCVKDCLWSDGGWVGSLIGCGSPYYNQCYCNANLASSATSYLSSCAIKYCTSEPDATSAVKVYAGYCSIAGYPIGEVNAAIQTSTQNVDGSGDAVTKTSLTIVTATSFSPSVSAGMSAFHPTRARAVLAAILYTTLEIVEVLSC